MSTKSECLKGMVQEIMFNMLAVIGLRKSNICCCFADTVTVLIRAIGDSDNSVNNVIIKSLTKIANSYPNEVIDIFCEFHKNTPKANTIQLANIVK